MNCTSKVLSENNAMSDHCKKSMLKYLVQKTFHASIGVVTKCFAEDTTGWYCGTAKTDSLRSELKIKTRTTSIAKAKNNSTCIAILWPNCINLVGPSE